MTTTSTDVGPAAEPQMTAGPDRRRAQLRMLAEQRRFARRIQGMSAQMRLSARQRRVAPKPPDVADDAGPEQAGERSSAFTIEIEPAREVVRLKPQGELDLGAVPELRAKVNELLAVGFVQLVIDLRGVSFIDTAGVSLLLALVDEARADGWHLSLIQSSSGQAQRLMTLTNALDRLPFWPMST